MGTKKNEEDIDEIKKSLDFLTEEMSVVSKQQKMIMELVAEVKTLRIQNAEKDKRLDFLESRVQALEQYSRINGVIVSGLHIKPRSYARAVTAGGSLLIRSMEELDKYQ
ncbi:unnamed protein product [Boreogadus saida]